MCVCGPESARELLKNHELIRVASKYPHIAKDYFNNVKHQTVEIIKLNGSVELAPIVGLSEVIVDIVETGTTLKENGLCVLEEVCDLSARIVVNQVSMKMENKRISEIIDKLKKLEEAKQMRILTLSEDTKKDILTNLLKRSPNSYGEYEGRVAAIIDDIKARRDEAVFEYTKKFDGYDLNSENILVTDEEIKAAYDEIDPKLVDIIRKALVNIRDYHAKQKRNSWFDANEKGTILGQKITPLKRVGVYVPGGKAAYPSSVLMNVVPAKVAGVDEIIMTTPPSKDGKIYCGTLVAAKEAGVDKIYKSRRCTGNCFTCFRNSFNS